MLKSALVFLAAPVLCVASSGLQFKTSSHAPTRDAPSANATKDVPECAIKCLSSACDLGDEGCVCARISSKKVMDCSMSSCTFAQAISARRLIEVACDASTSRTRVAKFNYVNVALGMFTGTIALARLVFKRFISSSRSFTPDDWVILATLVVGLASVLLLSLGLTAHGLGRDIWTLDPDGMVAFGFYFYLCEILYIALMAMVKLALSLFYLAIFPGSGARRLLWATAVFQVVFGLAFIIKDAVQCMKPNFYWNRFSLDADPNGHCINVHASGWVNAVLGVAIDIWLFAIPIFQLRKLQLHWKKKIVAGVMFLTGALVTLVSILRLNSLKTFANTTNPTWDQWTLVLWSTVEINTGIICTSLPAVRLMLLHLFPRILSTVTSTTSRSRTRPESMFGEAGLSSHALKPPESSAGGSQEALHR
ncbi:AT DNA binding protein [Purpureocillium lavendulum]|uniref:AT DNA binding protein n=1 Tax=Purpureocillium lavendulum TaxID=1247861 RepID=A0AB34FXL2_9HYPO|nr:AT DNA binding protein [Purpureocillium lavendulum]